MLLRLRAHQGAEGASCGNCHAFYGHEFKSLGFFAFYFEMQCNRFLNAQHKFCARWGLRMAARECRHRANKYTVCIALNDYVKFFGHSWPLLSRPIRITRLQTGKLWVHEVGPRPRLSRTRVIAVSRNPQHLVGLHRKPPGRVGLAVVDCLHRVGGLIWPVHRLQKAVLEIEVCDCLGR